MAMNGHGVIRCLQCKPAVRASTVSPPPPTPPPPSSPYHPGPSAGSPVVIGEAELLGPETTKHLTSAKLKILNPVLIRSVRQFSVITIRYQPLP